MPPITTPGRRALFAGAFLIVAITAGALVLRAGAPGLDGSQDAPDVRHYDLRIEPDFAARRLRLIAAIDIANPGRAAVFEFGLSDRYDRVEVREASSPVTLERGPGWVGVHLAEPGEQVRLTFELEGAAGRSEDEQRDVLTEDDLFLLWSDRFYPIVYDDWATVHTTLVLPEGFQAIAPGRRAGTVARSGLVEHRFETLLHPASDAAAERIFDTSSDVVRFFRDAFGGYAFDGYAFVTVEGIQARRAFPGFVGYSERYLAQELERTGHDAHETSLLWWGYTFRGSGPGNWQWTEGLGDYAEFLYDRARGLPIPQIFRYFRETYLATDFAAEPHYAELQGNTPQHIVHGKYPWLMSILHQRVGDEAFLRAMRLLGERFRFRTFTVEELVATLEQGTGADLKWWREEWLERRGVPILEIEWQAVPANSGFHVQGRIEQQGELYHIPLELAIRTVAGELRERIEVQGGATPFRFFARERPEAVVPDPDGWILARIRTEERPLPLP